MIPDVSPIVDAVKETFANPTGDITTSVFVLIGILLLMLMAVSGLLLAGTPKKRRVVKRRRYRVVPAASVASDEADEDSLLIEESEVSADAADEESPVAPGPVKAKERGRFRKGADRVILAVTGAFVVPLLIASALIVGYVATGSDAVCGNTCHAGQKFVHNAATLKHASCAACHETPGLAGIPANLVARGRMAVGQARGVTSSGPAVVESRSCLRCHAKILRVTTESSRGIRMSHKEPDASGRVCISCHATTGHAKRPDYSMSTCLACHGGAKASTECATCHLDDPYDATARTQKSEESSATLGSGLISYPVVAVGDVGCGGCHNEKRDCDSCHGLRLPHSSPFLTGGHARLAAFEKKASCYKCHEPDSCTTKCHLNFETGHASNWKQAHAEGPRDAVCGCHASRSKRTTSMCLLCHDF